MSLIYRPWGSLHWLLDKLPGRQWDLVCSLGPEERATACATRFPNAHQLRSATAIRLKSPNSRFSKETERLLAEQERAFLLGDGNGGTSRKAMLLELFCREEILIRYCRDAVNALGECVIIDISSLPKRVFFPLLTCLLQDCKARDVVVSYTIPTGYSGVLSEDAEPWKPLPMYNPSPDELGERRLVIGVGYQTLHIASVLDEASYNAHTVKLLFPFPSLQPGLEHNWSFVSKVDEALTGLPPGAVVRYHNHDASMAFDRLLSLSEDGRKHTVMAPFGPKPCSLAMCLFGIASRRAGRDVHIGYTQPRAYNPKYSVGVAERDGHAVILAYAVRLGGRDLYLLGSAGQ